MIRNYITILFLYLTPIMSFSQITIFQTDMPVIGDTIPRAIDTLTTETGGNGGANQTWDFSSAIPHIQQNTAIINPAATPYSGDFPTSNMAMTNDGISFAYFNMGSTDMIIKGAAGDLLNSGIIIVSPLNPDLTLYLFSVNYGNTLSDDYGFDVTTDGSVFNPLLDSVRLKRLGTVVDTVDGWGTTITPTGSYNSLRIKRIDYRLDSIWTKLPDPPFPFPPSPWSFLSATMDTVLSYSWLAKETRLALAELSFDSLGNPNRLTYSLVSAIPVGISEIAGDQQINLFPNPASDQVQFTLSRGFNNKTYQLQLYNSIGREVLNMQFLSYGKESKDINTSRLPAGIYFYVLSNKNTQEQVLGKFVIMRKL